jgi:predicted lipoprotein with Yx(FWY)xxD motif
MELLAAREEKEAMGKKKFAVVATLVVAGAMAATAAVASTNNSSTVSLRTTKVGKVLVAANGRTLYLFTADKSKKSTCYGQCASYWPPLIGAKPTVGMGLKVSLLGTTKRKGGGSCRSPTPATRSTSSLRTRRLAT